MYGLLTIRMLFDHSVLQQVLNRHDKILVRNKVYELFADLSRKITVDDYPELLSVDASFTELARVSYLIHLMRSEQQITQIIEPYLKVAHQKLSKNRRDNPRIEEARDLMAKNPKNIRQIAGQIYPVLEVNTIYSTGRSHYR